MSARRSVAVLAWVVLSALSAAAATSALVTIDSTTGFRPVRNSMAAIAAGETVVYDDPANPSGKFFGVYQLEFTLDKYQLDAENTVVDVFLRKNGEAWKKIAEVKPPDKPRFDAWVVRSFWNSRQPAFDWRDELDASAEIVPAFRANADLKLRVRQTGKLSADAIREKVKASAANNETILKRFNIKNKQTEGGR